MTNNEPDGLSTLSALHEVVRSTQTLADQIGLTMVAIKLDGAIVELEKAMSICEVPTHA